jgi:hypothetical protein
MPDEVKERVVTVTPTKVSSQVYNQLGSGTKQAGVAEVQQTTLEKVQSGGMIAAEILVPGVYAARRWKDMSGGEKALAIGIDVICVIPFASAGMRGARAVSSASRLERMAGAVKGVGGEAVNLVRAPVDMVVHPIQSAKGMVGGVKASGKGIVSILEDVAHPNKIPEAVLTTTEGTVRLPIRATDTPEQALLARDKLVDLVNRGERPVIEIGGIQIELAQSAFMKEVSKTGGGLVHTTPMGEAWEQGAKVTVKPGMPASEQGLFLSHEPLPRFVQVAAFGGTGSVPVFRVVSQVTEETGKIYRGAAEMERKLGVGAKVYKPAQRLFTRVGVENIRVEIWLDKPLSRASIAKLKAMSLVEGIKTLYTPAIKITKLDKGLTESEIRTLGTIIKDSGDAEVASRLERTARIAERGRVAPPTLFAGGVFATELVRTAMVTRTERVIPRTAPTRTGQRESIRATPREIPRTLSRESPREPTRTPPREVARTPTREVPREPVREPPREPVREQLREPDRIPPREPARIPPRTPDRIPPREDRIPDEGKPPRYRKSPPSNALQIEHVEGIPDDPGVVSYEDGIVSVKISPPYREGTQDIDYDRLPVTRKGKGSQEATLKVTGGKAPKLIQLSRGISKTSILKGKRMTHTRQGVQRGPGLMDSRGKVHKQRRGSVI